MPWTSGIVGGLGKRVSSAIQEGETVVAEALTASGQALVLTDRAVLIVKEGMAAEKVGNINRVDLDKLITFKLARPDKRSIGEIEIVSAYGTRPELKVQYQEFSHNVMPVKELLEKLTAALPGDGTGPIGQMDFKKMTSGLTGKLGGAINATLRPSEVILDELENVGEGIVVTSERVLIVKGGSASQALFGQKVKSYQFDSISTVEVSAGLIFGRIQITASGSTEGGNSRNLSDTAKMENVVQITRNQLPAARALANLIEKQKAQQRQPLVSPQSSERAPASLADELIKLAALRDDGVLTEEEFIQAKRRLIQG